MCKWHWDAGVQLQFTQGLDCKNARMSRIKTQHQKTAPFSCYCSSSSRLKWTPTAAHTVTPAINTIYGLKKWLCSLAIKARGSPCTPRGKTEKTGGKNRRKKEEKLGTEKGRVHWTEKKKRGQGEKQRDGEAGNERKNWERQRIETHKTETNTSSKPRKPVLIFSSSIAPLQAKKEEPKQQIVTFIVTETKGK